MPNHVDHLGGWWFWGVICGHGRLGDGSAFRARQGGFCALPVTTYLLLLLIVAIYIVTAEFTKRIFYRKVKF